MNSGVRLESMAKYVKAVRNVKKASDKTYGKSRPKIFFRPS